MNSALSGQNSPIDVDGSYRRSSAVEASRPSEWVRRKVLAHASQQGAERAVRDSAKARASTSTTTQTITTPTRQSPARFAVFGAVAAVVVACAAWYFLSPRSSSGTAASPTRQTAQATSQVTNASEPSTSDATAPAPSASAELPAVASAPAAIEPTSSAGTPRLASISQAPPSPPASAGGSPSPTTSGRSEERRVGKEC